jgi:hypothetical protein
MPVDITHFGHSPSERDEILAEAETSVGRTALERWAMFESLQRLLGAIWDGLTSDEVRRRLEIAERLDPRPDPWWRNVKPEGLP